MQSIKDTDALIVVDVQKDFCPGGSLPVPNGNKVIPVLNQYIKLFERVRSKIFATRDWHPPNHISFKQQGGKWPPHCVKGTEGAEFHPDLILSENVVIISKATTLKKEAYSGFDDTNLAEELENFKIKRVYVGGLATDYCVKNTVLDSLKRGYSTYLLEDAIMGVNIQLDDSKQAIITMLHKGAEKITIKNLIHPSTN